MLELTEKAQVFLSLFHDFKIPELIITELPSGILGYAVQSENKILLCSKGIQYNPIEAQDTYLHELAHILTYHLFGDRVLDHGSEWRSIAQKLGAKPSQTQSAKTPIKTYYIYDNGAKIESVSKRMHNMIQSGKSQKFKPENWIKELT